MEVSANFSLCPIEIAVAMHFNSNGDNQTLFPSTFCLWLCWLMVANSIVCVLLFLLHVWTTAALLGEEKSLGVMNRSWVMEEERDVALSEADDLSLAPIILSVENGGGVQAVFCWIAAWETDVPPREWSCQFPVTPNEGT